MKAPASGAGVWKCQFRLPRPRFKNVNPDNRGGHKGLHLAVTIWSGLYRKKFDTRSPFLGYVRHCPVTGAEAPVDPWSQPNLNSSLHCCWLGFTKLRYIPVLQRSEGKRIGGQLANSTQILRCKGEGLDLRKFLWQRCAAIDILAFFREGDGSPTFGPKVGWYSQNWR